MRLTNEDLEYFGFPAVDIDGLDKINAVLDSPIRNHIREVIEKNDDILTSDFWDCECPTNYIHPAAQESCPNCDCDRNDCPDSRAREVLALNTFYNVLSSRRKMLHE